MCNYGNVDLKNYQNIVLEKMKNSTEFYNSLADNQKKLIDELGESYGVDLENFQTIESKKLEFQAQIIKNLASNYSKYAGASLDGLKSQQDAMLIHGGYDPKELEALSYAINAIDSYNYKLNHIATGADLISSWTPNKFSLSDFSTDPNSDTKEVEEYTVKIDGYREAVERLNRVQEKRENLETRLSNAGSLEEEMRLHNELLDAYRSEQDALHTLNDLRDQTISENVDKLRGMGFDIEYDPDKNHLFIRNLEHINELVANGEGEYESVQEATNALRKEVEDLVDATEDLNNANRDGSSAWMDRQYDKRDKIIEHFESAIKGRENAVTLAENHLENAIENQDLKDAETAANNIIDYYKEKQKNLHALAEYYRSQGYSDTSDEVSALSDAWWECENSIQQAKQQIIDNLLDVVSATSEAVDDLQNAYQTLQDAADEYAQNGGFISIDAYQSILDLGPQYMQYLKDENGLLVINRERIEQMIAAKTKQLALDNAMTYVERLKLALQKDSIEDLNELLFATTKTTGATWDLVYANLAMLGLDDEQYQAALHNINAMRSLADTAVDSIGKTVGGAEDGFDSILNYVMDMLKQQVQNQIDALNEMKEAYGEIIDQRKAALDAAKKEANYEKDKASKLKEIAKLQARIDALSLDDSREAQAERAKLLEELAEKQDGLNELQSDKALEGQKEALDEMKDAYNDEKDDEIKKLEDSISSQQKLYEKAMDYIRYYWENGWNELKTQLLQWNYDVGNNLESEITTAWDNCLQYITANPLYLATDLIDKMKKNSSEWHTASSDRREELSNENKNYASQIGTLTGSEPVRGQDGVWYMPDGSLLYGSVGSNSTVGKSLDAQVNELVSRMKQNSADWHSAGKDEQLQLKADNVNYARQIEDLLKNYGKIGKNEQLTLGRDGWWYLPDGRKLYDVYKGKYHTGGIVGDKPLKPNERYIKAENGELVLTSDQQNSFAAQIERIGIMTDKFMSESLPMIQSVLPDFLHLSGSTINNVTDNSKPIEVHFGDTIINGGSESAHVIADEVRKISRENVNQIAQILKIKM